jgi:hypothetical protein
MAAGQGNNHDEEEEKQEQNDVYAPILFDGTLPPPTTNIAQDIHTTPPATQTIQTNDFYTFLQEENSQLLDLNVDTAVRTAIISIPGSSKVKLVYAAGLGASGIGVNSPIDDHLLFLYGNGGHDIGNPIPIVLPRTLRDNKAIAVMTEAQFKDELSSQGRNFTYPLVPRIRVQNTKNIMQLAPIPAYLIYDGITSDVNAALVYERVLSLDNTDSQMFMHLKSFLLSCLCSHNAACNKPYVPHNLLLAPAPNEARLWAGSKFRTIFHRLIPPPPQPENNNNLAALLAQLLPLQQQALQQHAAANQQGQGGAGVGEEKKDDDQVAGLSGMSQQELESTLVMCGFPPHSPAAVLPQWFLDHAEKGMTDAYKLTILRKHIMDNFHYDDAEVPLTATLLKNINKRNWLGKDGNVKRPSLLNATEGLSPFIVLDLDEDEVARINYAEDAIEQASSVTLEDITSFRKKVQPKVPTTADEFMLLLKRYANLLFAIFSRECPLFQCVVTVINALKDYSRAARGLMSTRTRASILWIILLQSRTFALGTDTILAEFATMQASLAAKVGVIHHAEVPLALVDIPKPPKRKPNGDDPPPDQAKKPTTRNNPNCWHPLLKAKLSGPLAKAGYPSFTSIMQFVEKNPSEIISDRSSWCTPNAFFGSCYLGDKCKRQHKIVTDAQAEKILQILEKFISHPDQLKAKGQ